MARHIVDVHKGVHNMDMEQVDIEIPLLKKYIAYARSKVSPRLTEVIIFNSNLFILKGISKYAYKSLCKR
jgi:hypothetical protein